ncbi:MAG TPA: hypothetical protein ENN69_02730, partial [Spirochaetia bacterium]|nr:hypothetical protein [Spirochaetia bacterium]
MKIPALCVIILVLSLSTASAQEFRISAGGEIGALLSLTYDNDPFMGQEDSGTILIGAAGAFVDLTYGRISVQYLSNISPHYSTMLSGEQDVWIIYISYQALLKLPLQISDAFTLWSGAGVRFLQCLLMDT